MKKVLIGLLTMVTLVSLLASCSPQSKATTTVTVTQTAASTTTAVTTVPVQFRWKYQAVEPATGGVGSQAVWFCNEVTRRTGGRLTITAYPNIGLNVPGAGILPALRDQVMDAGDFLAAYGSGTVPAGILLDLPGMLPANRFENIDATNKVIAAFLPFAEQAYTEKGVIPLAAVEAEARQVFTKKPVTTASDLNGMKLRSAGGFDDVAVKVLGAVPTPVATGEIYTALERGVIDGAVQAFDPVRLFKWYELAKNCYLANYGSTTIYIAVSKASYDTLPADLKQLVRQVAQEAAIRASTSLYQAFSTSAMWEMQNAGMQIIQPSADIKTKLNQAAQDYITNTWLKDAGPVGQSALTAVQAALAAK